MRRALDRFVPRKRSPIRFLAGADDAVLAECRWCGVESPDLPSRAVAEEWGREHLRIIHEGEPSWRGHVLAHVGPVVVAAAPQAPGAVVARCQQCAVISPALSTYPATRAWIERHIAAQHPDPGGSL